MLTQVAILQRQAEDTPAETVLEEIKPEVKEAMAKPTKAKPKK